MAKLRPYPFMGVEPTELCKQLLHNKTLPPNCDFVEINATTALTSQTVSAKSQIEQMLESAKFGQPGESVRHSSFCGGAVPGTRLRPVCSPHPQMWSLDFYPTTS